MICVFFYGWLVLTALVCVVVQAVVNRRLRRPLIWRSQLIPRCGGCGYILLGLRSGRCPECGRELE